MKYLAFLFGLGACFFDPKASGPGKQENPQFVDGSVAGNDGTAGSSGKAGEGGGGTGAISGTGGAGTGGAGVGGMSGGGAGTPPPPPQLANGEACTEDTRCKSGHCDGICCDKGAECCKRVEDCTMQSAGMGMVCGDPANCQGSAGALVCTPEFKCMTMDGVPNDTACSNRTEASGCDYYKAVFCLGGEVQPGAPACATSCASDEDCDLDGHCDPAGKCVGDLGNGEPCRRGTDCTAGVCQHVKNGVGICCGVLGDCCKAPTDCPPEWSAEPVCDQQTCMGMETIAECNGNICGSKPIPNETVCNGKSGPKCGMYKDVVCMEGQPNRCKTSCMNNNDCNSMTAFCDAGRCVAKRPNGETCNNTGQCMSGNCKSNICCSANAMECCKTADDCKMIDLKCETSETEPCQGTRRTSMCTSFVCSYTMARIDDDRACTMGGSPCGNYKPVQCNGQADQKSCPQVCTNSNECDAGFVCRSSGRGTMECLAPEAATSGMASDPSGAAGASSGQSSGG